MENFDQPKIQYNRILIAIGTVVALLIIISTIVSNHRQKEYRLTQQAELDLQTRLADSTKNYQDSVVLHKQKIQIAFRDSIQIIKCYTYEPNSAGGVDFNIIWKNKTHRTIKYVRFGVDAINAVGDVVPCEIRGYNQGFKVTGPIRSGEVNGYGTFWECGWYNHSITKAKIRTVRITFMDDSEVEFDM
jgi:hypothetical protein